MVPRRVVSRRKVLEEGGRANNIIFNKVGTKLQKNLIFCTILITFLKHYVVRSKACANKVKGINCW